MYEEVKVRLKGKSPGLLYNNNRTVNTLDPFVKAMDKIKKKKKNMTEDDREQLRLLEYRSALYVDGNNRPIVPAKWLEGVVVSGAKKRRQGKTAKLAVMVMDDVLLKYSGPRDLEHREVDSACYNYDIVVVQRNRVFRCRPRFEDWSCEALFHVDFTQFDRDDFFTALKTGGEMCAIGDWRPRYGRFNVEEIV